MGIFVSCHEFTAVPEVNIVRFAGAWYELASFDPRWQRPYYERDVVLQYTAKQRGSLLYIEATRQAIVDRTVYTSTALLLPDRRYYPMLSDTALTAPGHFMLESTDGGPRQEPRPYVVALLDAHYHYALVLDPMRRSATVLARGKTLHQCDWTVLRNEIARQFDIADVERHVRWIKHEGVDTPPVVADQHALCELYM